MTMHKKFSIHWRKITELETVDIFKFIGNANEMSELTLPLFLHTFIYSMITTWQLLNICL